MIYTDQQLIEKIRKMIIDFEDEVVEFKEARTNYSFKDIGKYFSALGNEANIRGFKEAWLIFGVTNKKEIVGTAYRQDGNLQNLKKEIVGGTNERATFMEIYEVNMDGHRIVAFQIPPATRGIPRTWNGAAYAREDENYKSSANGQGGLNKKSGWSRLVQRNCRRCYIDIMINYLALQGESYQNMLRILQKNGYFHCNILQ